MGATPKLVSCETANSEKIMNLYKNIPSNPSPIETLLGGGGGGGSEDSQLSDGNKDLKDLLRKLLLLKLLRKNQI